MTAEPSSATGPTAAPIATPTTAPPAGPTRPARPTARRLIAYGGHVGLVFHLISLVAVVLVGGLLVLFDSTWHTAGLIIAVILCQVALAALWTFGTGSFGFPGTAVVLALTAAVADVVLFTSDRLHIGVVGVVLALGLLAAFAHQVVRRAPRTDLTVSLAQTVVGIAVVEALALLVLVARLERDHVIISATLLCTGAALAVSHLADVVLPLPRISPDVRRGAVGIVLGIAAGATVAALRLQSTALSDVLGHVIFGVVVAAAAVLVSCAVTFVIADRAPDAIGGAVIQAIAPFAAAAPVALYVALLVA